MNSVKRSLIVLTVFAAVTALNYLFFVVVSLSGDVLNKFNDDKKEEKAQPKLMAEMVKTKKEEPRKAPQSRVRSVASSSSGGKSMQSSSKLNLSPDLSAAGSGDGAAFASSEMGAQVFEEGDVDKQAVPVYFPQPAFPEEAKKLGIGGEVSVFFTVGTNGKVVSIEKIDAPHPSFDKSVRKTFAEWKFNPAENQGIPVNSKKSIVIDFTIQ